MKITCICVGKKHDSGIAGAIGDYTKRLARYVAFEWLIVPPAKGRMRIDEAKRTEGATIAVQIKDDDYVVLLDESGAQLSSGGLADILDAVDMQTTKRLLFVIGGAYGVTDGLKRRANQVWSLSTLTFPHQLVRLILVEQLYRANTIRRGEPYHHE